MIGGLINFAKYRKVGSLIREVMQQKSGQYSLAVVEPLQKYLKKYEVNSKLICIVTLFLLYTIQAMNEVAAYAVSLQLEPRTKVTLVFSLFTAPSYHKLQDVSRGEEEGEEEENEVEYDERPYIDVEVISKEAWANSPSALVRASGDSNSYAFFSFPLYYYTKLG